MSIIQDALKKAQGDFTVKKAPEENHQIAPIEPVKDEPALFDIKPHPHREERKSPSLRLPALVSVLAILLLAYGVRPSLQYAGRHNSAPKVPKNAAQPVVSKDPETGIAGIFGQSNKVGPINFMGPRQSLFVLSGIMYTQSRPQAIINGQVLEEGDKINDATVLAIEKDCVLMDLNDTNMRLELDKKN